MLASNNKFPSLLVGEGAAPSSPAAGSQRLFVDSADHKLKRIDSAGTIIVVEAPYALPSSQSAATAYTLAVADRGTVKEFTATTAVTVTVPPASTADLGADAVVNIYQAGSGQITIAAGAGVTLRAPDGAKTAKQYAEVSLRRRGSTDEWVLSGNVAV